MFLPPHAAAPPKSVQSIKRIYGKRFACNMYKRHIELFPVLLPCPTDMFFCAIGLGFMFVCCFSLSHSNGVGVLYVCVLVRRLSPSTAQKSPHPFTDLSGYPQPVNFMYSGHLVRAAHLPTAIRLRDKRRL